MIPYTLPNPPQNFPNCTTHTPQVFLTTLSPFTAPKQHLRQSPVPALHTPSATMTKRQPEDLATSDKLRSLVDAVPDDASPNDLREMIEFLRGILKGAERKRRPRLAHSCGICGHTHLTVVQDVIQASNLGSLRGTVELLELDHKADTESYRLRPVKTTEPVEVEEWLGQYPRRRPLQFGTPSLLHTTTTAS